MNFVRFKILISREKVSLKSLREDRNYSQIPEQYLRCLGSFFEHYVIRFWSRRQSYIDSISPSEYDYMVIEEHFERFNSVFCVLESTQSIKYHTPYLSTL